jgi:hypothetical protein
MKNTPTSALYDLPLAELRMRADRACESLREMQSHVARPPAASECTRAGSLRAIDDALAAVDRLIPGVMEPPCALLARVMRALAPHERATLRQAIDAERAARERLARLLGEVSPTQAEDVLARVELQKSIATELAILFRVVERAHRAPVLTA